MVFLVITVPVWLRVNFPMEFQNFNMADLLMLRLLAGKREPQIKIFNVEQCATFPTTNSLLPLV